MKVMSWNTLYGGFDGDDGRRFKLQAEAITEVGPDILLIQEAKRFEADGNRRLYQMERALGMRGFLGLAPHTGQNTAVFACPGIEPVSFASDSIHFHHAAAIATLRIPDVDIAHELGQHATPTVPGAAFPDAEFVPFRADYFVASKALSRDAKSYAVIRDGRTGRASDPYPIVAEFSPAPGAQA